MIRPYTSDDYIEWRRMRTTLWPEQTEADMVAWLLRHDAAVFVAEGTPGHLCGFIEVGERSCADGCETSPVAYVEGWYVDDGARRQRVGARLIEAAEAWARDQGYRELASDTQLDNTISQTAHQRLGFEETERLVTYRKKL
jgi:aminoglycoside 6'-N-acetyltransferase I